MKLSLLAGAAITAVVAAFAAPASAAVINGSFTFAPGDSETYTPNNINFTSFSWAGISVGVRHVDFGGGSLVAPLSNGTTITSTTLTSVFSTTAPTVQDITDFLTWTDNNTVVYHYEMTSWVKAAVAGNITGIDTLGILTSSNGVNQAAAADFSFNQTVQGSQIAVSGFATFATGASLNTPEPATLAIVGTALAGLGVARRRRG